MAGLAVTARYIYWTNEEGNEIGRARLNGTRVNQGFVTGASFPDAIKDFLSLHGVAVAPSRW